jgi:16S rRNA (cytosine1402-N4)-methyltransferase
MPGESLEQLAIQPEEVYVDATAGLGGHTGEIARRLTSGFVIANDQDAESLEIARRNTAEWADRIRYHHGPFSRLDEALKSSGVDKAAGIIADLGVSRYQLTDAERGFSILSSGPLDMRMDRSRGRPASEIVNFTSEKELAGLIYRYGEERRSRRIARAILRARPIQSTAQLARAIEQAVPRTGKLHPATQTFMALRLVVNDEPGELDRFLSLAPDLLKPGGRLVVITFMSLEDRRVKHAFQELARSGRAVLLTRHVVRPTSEEVERNPPSRSAKLRAVEMR